jgi:hypothetical protein
MNDGNDVKIYPIEIKEVISSSSARVIGKKGSSVEFVGKAR